MIKGMADLLLLNHHGNSVGPLLQLLEEAGASVYQVDPASLLGRIPVRGYDGFVASGGYLKGPTHVETLRKYSEFFKGLERPFLGICLGMRILGYCYGARMKMTEPVVGHYAVSLKGFPLSPRLSKFTVYQNHRYELIRPLPPVLEDFTAGEGPVQAVKVAGEDRYAVQFHPEVGGGPAQGIISNFVVLCSRRR